MFGQAYLAFKKMNCELCISLLRQKKIQVSISNEGMNGVEMVVVAADVRMEEVEREVKRAALAIGGSGNV